MTRIYSPAESRGSHFGIHISIQHAHSGAHQKVYQQHHLEVGARCFAQVVILVWEGITFSSGKALCGGVQVFCPCHGELEGLMETGGDAQSPLSHALRKKGA